MKLTISIVSHGQGKLIDLLLKDIDKYITLDPARTKLVITKNIPEDLWKPESKKFELIIIENQTPRGFGANHNLALSRTNSDIFIVCNPDIRLTSAISQSFLTRVLSENGIFSAHVIDANKVGQDYFREEITPLKMLCRYVYRKVPEKKDWLAGMFLILNRETFKSLKGFDESFFMYVEDCDLSLRARAKGWKVSVLEHITVIHEARRNSRRKIQHLRWHITSLIRYFYKRYFMRAYDFEN